MRSRRTWLVGLLLIPAIASAAGAGGEANLVAVTASDLQRVIRTAGAQVVMVNIWATWCTPCREEFPDLIRLRAAYPRQELELLLVSADFDAVNDGTREFLREQGVDFVSYLKDDDDMVFIDSLSPEWSGALPATFVYDAAGELVDFWQGKANYDRLDRAVRSAKERKTR